MQRVRKYRVRPGFRHGRHGQYGPGDVVELTEVEAAGFLDKLEPVEDEQSVDVRSLTISDVLAAIEAGELSVAEALDAERSGRNRKTLIEALEAKRADGDAGQ